MRRREFITLLGGAAVAWPLAARAQQGKRVRHIGVLLAASADASEYQARIGAFQQELQTFGWTIGRNVRIDTRWAGTNAAEFADTRRNWSRSRRTSSWPMATRQWGRCCGDSQRADSVSGRRRSGRRRLRRQSGAAGGQCHRFHRSNTA